MKLFRKLKSKYYWYDFTVRGCRYRGSTEETKAARAANVASLKLAHAVEGADPLTSKRATLAQFAQRFLVWLQDARLEDKTKTYYRNGWRLLKATAIANIRLDQITNDCCEKLRFPRLFRQWELRLANFEKNVAQGGGMEDDRPCSESQTDEGVRTVAEARR